MPGSLHSCATSIWQLNICRRIRTCQITVHEDDAARNQGRAGSRCTRLCMLVRLMALAELVDGSRIDSSPSACRAYRSLRRYCHPGRCMLCPQSSAWHLDSLKVVHRRCICMRPREASLHVAGHLFKVINESRLAEHLAPVG